MKITKELLEELISEAFKNLDEAPQYGGAAAHLNPPKTSGGGRPARFGGSSAMLRGRNGANAPSQGGTKLDYDPSKSPLSSSPSDAATSAAAALGMSPKKIKTATDLSKSLRKLASDPKVFQGIQAAEFGEIISAFLNLVQYAKIGNAAAGPVKNAMQRVELIIGKAQKQAAAAKPAAVPRPGGTTYAEPPAKPKAGGYKLPGKTTPLDQYPTGFGGKQRGASGELEDIPKPWASGYEDLSGTGYDPEDPDVRAGIPKWRQALNKFRTSRGKKPMEEVKVSLTEDEIKLVKRLTNKK